MSDPTLAAAVAAALGMVLVTLTTVASKYLTSRYDRALAHQEVDLLKKLNPESSGAADLSALIEDRVARWRRKAQGRPPLLLALVSVAFIAASLILAKRFVDTSDYTFLILSVYFWLLGFLPFSALGGIEVGHWVRRMLPPKPDPPTTTERPRAGRGARPTSRPPTGDSSQR